MNRLFNKPTFLHFWNIVLLAEVVRFVTIPSNEPKANMRKTNLLNSTGQLIERHPIIPWWRHAGHVSRRCGYDQALFIGWSWYAYHVFHALRFFTATIHKSENNLAKTKIAISIDAGALGTATLSVLHSSRAVCVLPLPSGIVT